jgi:hypothetical protein
MNTTKTEATMLAAIGILLAFGLLLSMILLFIVIMRVIDRREKTELAEIMGEHYHA